MRIRRIKTFAIAIVLALVASVLGIVAYSLPQQSQPELNRVMDFVTLNEAMLWVDDNPFLRKIGIRFPDRHAANPHLKLITIGEASLAQTSLGQWPWPRGIHGELLTKLGKAGGKVAAFDVIFLENSPAPGQDAK